MPPQPVLLLPLGATAVPVEPARHGVVATAPVEPARHGAVATALLAALLFVVSRLTNEGLLQPLVPEATALLATLLFVVSRLTNDGLLERIRCCSFSNDRSSSPPNSFGGMTFGVALKCRSDSGAAVEPRGPMGGVELKAVELKAVVSVIVDEFTTAADRARANASPTAFDSPRSPLPMPVLSCQGMPGVGEGDQTG